MRIDFPLEFGVLETTPEAAQKLAGSLGGQDCRFVLITGSTLSKSYSEKLLNHARLTPLSIVQLEDNSVASVYDVERSIRRLSPSCILGVGGGKVCDFAKRLAYIANLPLVLAPTIIANDGLISPIAVLLDDDLDVQRGGKGVSVSLPGRMPDEVLIDMSIVLQAPKRYLKAAACDLISNLTATNDWIWAAESHSEPLDFLAVQFSRMAAYKILDCRTWDIHSAAFTRSVVFGQMLSGIAMTMAGSSRPCSGSEHLISHALDALGLGMDVLHGEKVGITSRFCLHLQGEIVDSTEEFFEFHRIPKIFPGCKTLSVSEIRRLFEKARTMRPGRKTVLDRYSDAELTTAYLDYVATEMEAIA